VDELNQPKDDRYLLRFVSKWIYFSKVSPHADSTQVIIK
jgi:hypothetical protein